MFAAIMEDMAAHANDQSVRYEPDEACPPLVALGVGIQGVLLVLATIVLIVAVTARAGGQDDGYAVWAVFATLVIAGALTALQASRFWRLGAGHILIMGPTPNYIAVSVLALAAGGPALLASLTAAAALSYIGLAFWLPLLRRIITPVVSGVVLMLIAVAILPVALNRVSEVPDAAPDAAGPVTALATLAAIVALSMHAHGVWRICSPLIAIAVGCAVAVMFGAYDVQGIHDAGWVGLPDGGFPGFDLTPSVDFWALLPAFVVIALVGGVKNIGDCIAVQQVSWRRPRVTDFRLVQGSLNTNGLGILLSGLAGTPPTSVYSSSSPLLINLTGVASRRVGYAVGAFMGALSLLPKLIALLLAIPSPVMGAYLLTAIGVLFVSGVQTAVTDGLDKGKALTVGMAFSLGAGLGNQTIGADLLGETWGPLIDNGMLVGALAAVLLNWFQGLASRGKRVRLETSLHPSAADDIDEFLQDFASEIGWDDDAVRRLRSAGEEALMSLLHQDEDGRDGIGSSGRDSSSSGMDGSSSSRDSSGRDSSSGMDGSSSSRDSSGRDSSSSSRDSSGRDSSSSGIESPGLVVAARHSGAVVEMEFVAVFDGRNLEDRLAHLSEESQNTADMQEGVISLRLLRHYASSVQHQKFHGLDVVTIQVRSTG